MLPTVGQAILPAAAFPGGSYARRYSLYGARAGRIAGCSQDWLPHPRLTAKVTDYSIQPQLEAHLSPVFYLLLLELQSQLHVNLTVVSRRRTERPKP